MDRTSTGRRFHQVGVFSTAPLAGNPLAVVHDADGLDDDTLAALARWTNLSETTFLLPPTDPAADYRVRIYTPFAELPFAGHPTLGSCWAWLAAGGQPRQPGLVVQQCGVGIVRVRRVDNGSAASAGQGQRLAFAAPPLLRTGPLDAELLARIERALGLQAGDVLHHQWVDNGPGWCAVMLRSAAAVRAAHVDWPALGTVKLGVVGAEAPGLDTAFEVRAFVGPGAFEDPVTGSLNASLAQWLIGAGLAPPAYVAAQGSAMRRAGRIHVQSERDDQGQTTVWIGGDVAPCIEGEIGF